MTTRRKPAKKATKKAKSTRKAAKTTKKAAKSTKKAAKAPARRSPRAALSVVTSSKQTTKQRVAALGDVAMGVCENDEGFQSLLNILRDQKEPIKVRLATLQTLQGASFSVITFESCRGDYFATLRELVEDPDPEFRQRVLGILAREKDAYVQQRLLEGLQNPDRALVPPEKALQLLSYDVHAEAYSVARDIVNNPPNTEAKREALRLLSADASSGPVFEKLMIDKDEKREIRQISAAALQATHPRRFQQRARELLLDDKEYDDIQATALTGMTQFGDESTGNDEELVRRVGRLEKGKSAKVKKTAKRFLRRYRP
ncbi:MAG TPA: hypothetical protein VLA93_11460 [Pyrinomonadaceae bacterium]|nr:hypothetical protein [Pyrinomonadaceae bacterium]